MNSSTLDFPIAYSSNDARRRMASRVSASRRHPPFGTVLCEGRPVFRTQLARDLALLLDLDRDVVGWSCLPAPIEGHDADGEISSRSTDFIVRYADGSIVHLDAAGPDGFRPIDSAVAYGSVCLEEIRIEPALSNARDMMRYARRSVPLGDRIRLLAWLDDVSSVPLVEASSAMRESPEPIGAVMALMLKRFVFLEWQDEIIGPQTIVRLSP